jgi:hypothetical protein
MKFPSCAKKGRQQQKATLCFIINRIQRKKSNMMALIDNHKTINTFMHVGNNKRMVESYKSLKPTQRNQRGNITMAKRNN